MDRILVLMQAADFADAQTALCSAKENAAMPSALSFGVMLEYEPDEASQAVMAALEHLHFLCPERDAWQSMPELWQGESHVLMGHPAMRFTRNWDRVLLRELKRCPQAEKGQNVLTGFLPVREDPLDAVCPVGADAFTVDGELTFRHGTPLRYTRSLERGPFLHPDFVFGPAGFFRAMAAPDDAPFFLRAFAGGWHLYTLTVPAIRLVWSLPVPNCRVSPEHPQAEGFQQVFGVDFRTGSLSPQSRRGMMNEELDFQLRVPLSVRARDKLYRVRRRIPFLQPGKGPHPLCVTLCAAGMPEETQRWLRRLTELRHLPLLAYADPLMLRKITDFLPNVLEFKPRYMMDLPVDAPEALLPLSKPAILARARDRELTPSHYIWLDADSVQFPVYPGAIFRWEQLCTDKIVIAMVNGQPDPTMFCVPDALILTLAREMEARCLTFLNQRGDLPTPALLWQLMIREHPEWFQLMTFPVERQLFSVLISDAQ